jgi:DNA polymerase V
MFKEGYQYKKVGVMLSEISPTTHQQEDLWEPTVTRTEKLMRELDKLNLRYGRGTMRVSAQGAYKEWQMRQERKSPNYTTDWNAVPAVS